MVATLFPLLGGIGMFLLGMILLTDGLKALAEDALRRALVKFTGTPTKAFLSGVVVTLMVQASSATTVTVIGFVSAGLLTFPQAIGVVMGASLGTTGTGWIVALLGLKISLGFYALPLIGLGALGQLLLKGTVRHCGSILAGFGLIFVGIDTLQQGMESVTSSFPLATLPATGLTGHLLTVLIGIVMTILMQSSTAAVATTLTALHTGTVAFEQAASLIIGAAIGTTFTGAFAAIGGTAPAKRTALAHILFNTFAGLIAVIFLPLFLRGIAWTQEHLGLAPGATSLAAFHSGFIAIGVLLFLPIVRPFAAWIERILPDRGPILTHHLDDSLLHTPAVALEASRRALQATAREVLAELQDSLSAPPQPPSPERRQNIDAAIDRIQAFFAGIPPSNDPTPLTSARIAQIHAIDYLDRLCQRLTPSPHIRARLSAESLRIPVSLARQILVTASAGLAGTDSTWVDDVERLSGQLADHRRKSRAVVLEQTAKGIVTPTESLAELDAVRWLDRLGHHIARVAHHLGRSHDSPSTRPLSEPEPLDEAPAPSE